MHDAWASVALSMVPGVGSDGRRQEALWRVGSPAEVFRASARTLAAAVGDALAAAIRSFDHASAVAGQRAAAERVGARLVTLDDAAYPAGLTASPPAPPYLFVRGSLVREDALATAIVGSRRASHYGLRMAERLASDLAVRGVTVVSGLARGVDTAAHRGALSAGGRTVAVLGSGVDVVYPPESAGLAAQIAGAGAVVSQFPMGTAPLPGHFPLRNRVIAGLATGTVVVEAAERSGALITARLAAEMGREVYAVPGNVSSPQSEGTNRLIQDGAKLVRDWEDVVAEWPAEWRRALRTVAAPKAEAPARGETPAEERLLGVVGAEPVDLDLVVELSGLPTGQAAAGLVTLELRGLVRQLPGQRYVRG